MVCSVRARDDRLGTQHLERPSLAGLGAQDADQVVLEGQLVDDGEALAVLDDLERRRVLAPVQLDRALARKPEAARAAPVDLDALPVGNGPHDVGPPRAAGHAAPAELVHLDGHPAQLDDTRVLHERDADRARRRSGGDETRNEAERCREGRENDPHRRPRIHRISVRTTLSRSDVASGK